MPQLRVRLRLCGVPMPLGHVSPSLATEHTTHTAAPGCTHRFCAPPTKASQSNPCHKFTEPDRWRPGATTQLPPCPWSEQERTTSPPPSPSQPRRVRGRQDRTATARSAPSAPWAPLRRRRRRRRRTRLQDKPKVPCGSFASSNFPVF